MTENPLVRVVVFVVIVGVIVGVAFAAGVASNSTQPTLTETEGPDYDTAALQIEPIPAEGTVGANVDRNESEDGVVLVDTAHGNGFERTDIQPFLMGAAEAGLEVRFLERGDDLSKQLENASAFVVIDPRNEYSTEDAETIEAFVDDGGRLLLVAEPNQLEVQQSGLALRLIEAQTELTVLGSQFGISFGTDNLYNLDENDGNFRNVIATSTDAAEFDGVDRTVFSVPTHITADGGEPVLTAVEGTQRSSTRVEDEYVVGLRNGSVMALGDSSFLGGERHNVADNEVLIAELIGFLAEGSVDASPDMETDDDLGIDPGDDTGDDEPVEEEPIGDEPINETSG